jgi:eukaryotic-like serine/threonine-protein kinase
MDRPPPVLPGETLAKKYRVERLLGQGGMGIVVAARHLDLDERVAIKFLLETGPAPVERFLREARASAKVKGEHVCRIYDVGRLETDEPYIVMEYLEGVDLGHKLDSEGPQPLELVATWMIEACAALAEAHAHGIVHRDLKPANLFLANGADGSVTTKVLDFGISKLRSEADRGAMTRTATMLGSPLYMSPEQLASSRNVEEQSDIWSLGIVLYELLSGRHPFEAESIIQLAIQVRERPMIPLASVLRRTSATEPIAEDALAGLDRILARCLEKQPAARYASVADLAADLARFAPPRTAALAERLGERRARGGQATPRPLDARSMQSELASSGLGAAPVKSTPKPERESNPSAAGALGTAQTLPPPEDDRPASSRRPAAETHDDDALPVVDEAPWQPRVTFAPLQTTMGNEAPRRRWRALGLLFGGASLVLLLLLFALSRGRRPIPPAAAETRAVLVEPSTVTPAPLAAPPVISVSVPAPVVDAPAASPTPVTTVLRRGAIASAPRAERGPVLPTATARTLEPSAVPPSSAVPAPPPPPVPSASAASERPAPASTGKKKRELDRDSY